MTSESEYPTDDRSKAGRLKKRVQYNQEVVHGIVDASPILHVSFNAPSSDGPQFPTILPMLGAVGTFDGENEAAVYLHGSSAARLARLTSNDEIAVCVCATILDGYVLALAPFHNSCNYRSAVLFGYASIVSNPEEVQFALQTITNNANPNRWENSRHPPTSAEITSTGVMKVRIETASAKIRNGGPSDDKADLQNQEVTGNTWVGVVPTYLTLGDPIAADYNTLKQTPEYILDWVADANSVNDQKAVDAIESED